MQSAALASLKRKRDVPASRNAAVELGQLVSQINTAVDYMKEKRKEHSATQLLGYLSLQHADDELKNRLIYELKRLPNVQYKSDGLGGSGSFAYKPKIPVSNAEELKKYLSTRPSTVGVQYNDLRDGWPDCQPAVDDMEKRGEVLLIRDRKGGIKLVWHDEPSLEHKVSDDLKHAWNNIKLPANTDDLRIRLENAGLKPTSAPREHVKKAQTKDNRKRGPKRGTRTTNAHIQHLLKDYSHKKPGGGK